MTPMSEEEMNECLCDADNIMDSEDLGKQKVFKKQTQQNWCIFRNGSPN